MRPEGNDPFEDYVSGQGMTFAIVVRSGIDALKELRERIRADNRFLVVYERASAGKLWIKDNNEGDPHE